MVFEIQGDLIKAKAKYICHQVNCRGVMGSGVALCIRNSYPNVYPSYLEYCRTHNYEELMGSCLYVDCNGKCIINMFAQNGYGHHGRYTDMNAFTKCLSEIKNKVPAGETIAFPYKIGCGLGGGDWKEVYEEIAGILGDDYCIEFYRK